MRISHPLTTTLIAVALAATLTSCDGDRAPAQTTSSVPPAGTQTPAPADTGAASGPSAGSLTDWDGNIAAINLDHCGLDTANAMPSANGVLSAAAADPITIEGWAATPDLTNPGSVTLHFKGPKNGMTVAQADIPREDVSGVLNSQALANAGFRAAIPPGALPAGDYKLYVSIAYNNVPLVCDGKTTLRIN